MQRRPIVLPATTAFRTWVDYQRVRIAHLAGRLIAASTYPLRGAFNFRVHPGHKRRP
ncbi:hypothetical protein AB0B10_26060 [Micromonospora arborensis]|uniref:hypothetical protein n=1 Tax=Micromonospora arborensis TaxID=2116518 RepID=UPI003408C351